MKEQAHRFVCVYAHSRTRTNAHHMYILHTQTYARPVCYIVSYIMHTRPDTAHLYARDGCADVLGLEGSPRGPDSGGRERAASPMPALRKPPAALGRRGRSEPLACSLRGTPGGGVTQLPHCGPGLFWFDSRLDAIHEGRNP